MLKAEQYGLRLSNNSKSCDVRNPQVTKVTFSREGNMLSRNRTIAVIVGIAYAVLSTIAAFAFLDQPWYINAPWLGIHWWDMRTVSVVLLVLLTGCLCISCAWRAVERDVSAFAVAVRRWAPRFLLGLVVLCFALFVWPTPYHYDHVSTAIFTPVSKDSGMAGTYPVRIHRVTGNAEILHPINGWQKMGPSQP